MPDARAIGNAGGKTFFYAVRRDEDNLIVTNAVNAPDGRVWLTFSSFLLGNVNDQVAITCHSIAGAIQANVSDTGVIVSTNQIALLNTPTVDSYTGGGQCVIVRLAALATGHVTGSNGIELNSADAHYTLVGIAYIGASNAVNDSLTKRDVASWFNRRPKKMSVSCNSTMTTTSLTLKTPTPNTCEGEFVVFTDQQGSPVPAVQWYINTGISNSTSTAAAGNVTACFGTSSLSAGAPCGNTPEPETGTASLFSLGKIMPIGIAGITTTLTEPELRGPDRRYFHGSDDLSYNRGKQRHDHRRHCHAVAVDAATQCQSHLDQRGKGNRQRCPSKPRK